MTEPNYETTCFVVMPYGHKRVGPENREVDFDAVYFKVFDPAIKQVELPEGGHLAPFRAKESFFTGTVDTEMFAYLEYARFVVADTTGLNFNVGVELGVRYHARESGTALFQQPDTPRAFDVQQVRAFPYEYEPEENANTARELIRSVVAAALKDNRVDSPVHLALADQRLHAHQNVEPLLLQAENAIRANDLATAIGKYRQALELDDRNAMLHLRLGLLLKPRGEWEAARSEFARAVEVLPRYAEAHRELGIAQNKLLSQGDTSMPTGETELRRAVELNPDEFDALSALGGILKRDQRPKEALEMYERATMVSRGHAYPLLNAIILRATSDGRLALDAKTRALLRGAERHRRNNARQIPPYDPPWCFFDLAEIRMFLGDPDDGLRILAEGIDTCESVTDLQTHRNTLQLLKDAAIQLPGLDGSLALLSDAIAARTLM